MFDHGEPGVREGVGRPAEVLGWAGFRDVTQRHSLGLALLSAAVEAGRPRAQPVRSLAHIFLVAAP